MTHLVGIPGGDSGGVGGDPPLECGIAVASGARVTEQARFVQHRERDRIELERVRSEEHTSELQSLMRISYAVFCMKKQTHQTPKRHRINHNHNTRAHNNYSC